MPERSFTTVYQDEFAVDLIIAAYALLVVPLLMSGSLDIARVLSFREAFTGMMLFFFLGTAYVAALAKHLGENEMNRARNSLIFAWFVVLIMPLIEGPRLLAPPYGLNPRDMEAAFMGPGAALVIAGGVAGTLSRRGVKKLLERIPERFVKKMIIAGLASAFAAAAAVPICLHNTLFILTFALKAKYVLSAFIITLVMSGLAAVRLFMMARPPFRPLNIVPGVLVLAFYTVRSLAALRIIG